MSEAESSPPVSNEVFRALAWAQLAPANPWSNEDLAESALRAECVVAAAVKAGVMGDNWAHWRHRYVSWATVFFGGEAVRDV